ncbi:MAG TPA: hypothetical protein VL693_19105 [Vicinamibacterales bacterium]|nr:hypothetical protein [Vicinamibacterales bacterium]
MNLDGSRLSSSVPLAITVPSNVLLARQDGYWILIVLVSSF